MQSFSDLSALPPALQQATAALGYEQMTDIQAAALPLMLERRDVIAQALTGSGKTAAFGLALLALLDAESPRLQSLVLVNYGNATGVEIFNLSAQIMQSVYDTFGVQLEREVNVY